jgi:hypothetical protein
MIRTTIEDAARNLRDLVDAALEGQEVYISAPNGNGERLIQLQVVLDVEELAKRRKAGSAKGLIWMSDDFDEPLEDFAEYQ